VQYANITKGYGVKYWEIGNEIYGNGYYGADWEADNHPSKSPAAYAQNVVQYASAMKTIDPTRAAPSTS
jgi:alpha-L-arabinofuranosidase